MAYYECSLSMEAAYRAWIHLCYGDIAEKVLAEVKTRGLRHRFGRVKPDPEYLRRARSPDYRAAADVLSALEDRVVSALIAGERLSSGSEVTVLIHEDHKETFDDAVDATLDESPEYQYREQRHSDNRGYYERTYKSIIGYFAPEPEDEDEA